MSKSDEIGNENMRNPDRADLIWDEYKYRHDLIWKHLIRSTIAVIGSISLLFSDDVNFDAEAFGIPFFQVLSILIILYVLFTWFVIYRELILFDNIKRIHRRFQNRDLPQKIHEDKKTVIHEKEPKWYEKLFWESGFNQRVAIYLTFLFLIASLVCFYLNYDKLCELLRAVVVEQ
jgi:hypothetical protein